MTSNILLDVPIPLSDSTRMALQHHLPHPILILSQRHSVNRRSRLAYLKK